LLVCRAAYHLEFREMKVANFVAISLSLCAMVALRTPAYAETKLTDFGGTWQGVGTDRSTPFESAQKTRCRASINATLTQMSSNIVCNGAAGLTKVIQLNIILSGDAFTGTLTQKATMSGSNSPTVLNGSINGRKTNTTAEFTVSFPGLTPSVAVTLTLMNPASFSMLATTIGGQLMNVVFNRT
jgi:hypothetical protein